MKWEMTGREGRSWELECHIECSAHEIHAQSYQSHVHDILSEVVYFVETACALSESGCLPSECEFLRVYIAVREHR